MFVLIAKNQSHKAFRLFNLFGQMNTFDSDIKKSIFVNND
ncbi:hypothetical protein LCGC14_0869240 [marine sediment metagenome]|uniref:Uncharacterized protein n=1 Tax=marine sediment metagenome TaxID=412755 RepID=A0A0F9SC63_9ZZZZ